MGFEVGYINISMHMLVIDCCASYFIFFHTHFLFSHVSYYLCIDLFSFSLVISFVFTVLLCFGVFEFSCLSFQDFDDL